MKRFKGNIGQEYDMFRLVCPHYDVMRKGVGDIIADNNSMRILEIGSGSGYTTSAILLANPHSNIIAIDNEPVMIEQAKFSLDGYFGEGRLEFVEADALLYLQKSESESFDAFISGFTLHNFGSEYRNKVLIEAYRVLKRGGLFINADKYAMNNADNHKRNLDSRLRKIRLAFSSIGKKSLQGEWTKHYLEDENPDVIQMVEESIREMQEIGFRNADIIYRHEMEVILIAFK